MNKKIYIFAPAYVESGGPEALHQLRYYMEKQGMDAWIVYIVNDTEKAEQIIPNRYLHYFPNELKCIKESEYNDKRNHLLIAPEFYSTKLLQYRKSKKAIWWLGVLAYDGRKITLDELYLSQFNFISKFLKRIKYNIKNLINCTKNIYLYKVMHITNYCASQFAYDYVNSIKHQNAIMLVEPISKEFLDADYVTSATLFQRENNILYNPSKLSPIMSELLLRNKFNYIALKNYSSEELIQLYRKSKLYVDFGFFPGPERIPKEAVFNGCSILVRKVNASMNKVDVAILEQYKVENLSNADALELLIESMLENYEEQFNDFNNFRNRIKQLEQNFEVSIRKNFSEYLS